MISTMYIHLLPATYWWELVRLFSLSSLWSHEISFCEGTFSAFNITLPLVPLIPSLETVGAGDKLENNTVCASLQKTIKEKNKLSINTKFAKHMYYHILNWTDPNDLNWCTYSMYVFVTGLWNWPNVTLGLFHFIVPANSCAHTLPIHSGITILSWMVCLLEQV